MTWFASSQGNGHYAPAICPTGYQNNFPICGLWHRLMNANLFTHRIRVTQCAPNHFHWTNCNKSLHLFHFMPLADPRGCWIRPQPPLSVQILLFSCSFWRKIDHAHAHLWSWRPPSGETWFRHCMRFAFCLRRKIRDFQRRAWYNCRTG